MHIASLLNAVEFSILEQNYEISLDFLGKFARAIIEGIGIIGLGIIVFTLVLKAITLPFDIYQRVKMRKQTLIMRQMQPELEKLQKQYANDKKMYNQKMMELYKKNGYSMLGACLPMIISLVILIVAFQGFRAYSQYANLDTFRQMSISYNAAILEHAPDGLDYSLQKDENDEIVMTDGKVFFLVNVTDAETGETTVEPREVVWQNEGTVDFGDGLVYIMTEISPAEDAESEQSEEGEEDKNEPVKYLIVKEDGKYLYYQYNLKVTHPRREYLLDVDLLCASDETIRPELEAMVAASLENEDPGDDIDLGAAAARYVRRIGAKAAAETFHSPEHNPSFLWIKNVWYPDVSYNHPIPDYDTFKNQLNVNVTFQDIFDENGNRVSRPLSSVLDSTRYGYLTQELSQEKSEPNGYFILIILSIGLMVASQLISMKSNKESNKYQTVDGRGATSQKVMLVVMPLIYAIFAFFYSAAFSIYMTVSSLVAILVTVFSNLILGKIFKKKEEAAFREEHSRELPWMKEEGKKKKKK